MSVKDITIKQYNGTAYDSLYPRTKTSQVEGLDSAITTKINAKVTYGTEDIGEGAPLATGTFYFVYEE